MARLAGAMVASLALHGVALNTLTQLPRGSHSGEWLLSHAGTGRLRANLSAAAPGVESKQPEALAPPPESLQSPETPDSQLISEQPPAKVAASGPEGDDPRSRQPDAEPGSSDAPSAGVLAAPVYYPPGQLDRRPQITVHIEPVFPPGAPVATGRVVLRLYISPEGEVERIAIVSAEPPGVFEQSALDAFSAARFTPGMKNGIAVRSLISIEALFGAPAPISARPLPAPR